MLLWIPSFVFFVPCVVCLDPLLVPFTPSFCLITTDLALFDRLANTFRGGRDEGFFIAIFLAPWTVRHLPQNKTKVSTSVQCVESHFLEHQMER